MAKALYGFLTYPESIETEAMQQWLSDTLDVDWKYCLHDKDVQKDGKTPKKPHVHWLIGYEKSAPSIKELLQIFFARWYYQPTEEIPPSDGVENFVNAIPENVSHGTVENIRLEIPKGEAKPLIPKIIQMKSAHGAEDYLEHKNQPEKAQYIGLSVESEYWDVGKYLTYLEKRAQKRNESSSEVAALLGACRQSGAKDYPEFMDWLVENMPDALGLAFQKAYSVEKYLNFRPLSEENRQLREENAQLLDELSIKDMQVSGLQAELKQVYEHVEKLQEKFASLGLEYTELTGEPPIDE